MECNNVTSKSIGWDRQGVPQATNRKVTSIRLYGSPEQIQNKFAHKTGTLGPFFWVKEDHRHVDEDYLAKARLSED
jgi:hypothetical protein